MFEEEEEEQERGGYFLLAMGILAAIILVVVIVDRSQDELPSATVTGPTTSVVEEVETTTTEAPATTTTTAAPTTTTTEAPAPFTMWDALVESGEATQFTAVGGALGLQADLEALENEDGSPINRTLFAPSDEALAALGPEAIGALTADIDAANALVGYHFLEESVDAEGVIALDGQTVTTRTGLPLRINIVDGDVVLNDVTRVTRTDIIADNGVVHIVDMVLTPPTVNEVIGLENIEFEVASAAITPAGQEELELAIEFFLENESVNAVIEGHTDTDGPAEDNLALSQARAQSVLDFLVTNGIAADRLTAAGFGETQPILDADGVEDKEASRRIEFVVR